MENDIENFHNKVDSLLFPDGDEELDVNGLVGHEGDWYDVEGSGADLSGGEWQDEERERIIKPETMPLFMPSSLDQADLKRMGLVDLAKKELELRKGQANDVLEELRLALGHKSLLFRTKVSAT